MAAQESGIFLFGDGQAQARLCENNFFQRDVGIDAIFPAILYVLVQFSRSRIQTKILPANFVFGCRRGDDYYLQ
jgi:hypothetical protein